MGIEDGCGTDGIEAVFHTEGGDFPLLSSSFPPQALLPHILCLTVQETWYAKTLRVVAEVVLSKCGTH